MLLIHWGDGHRQWRIQDPGAQDPVEPQEARRRGSRIQKGGGGVRTFRRGGGVRTGISGADPNCCRALGKSTSNKKIADSRSPPKKPVSAHGRAPYFGQAISLFF